MSKNNFHHTFVTDREDIARYLDSLKEGFNKGVLTFNSQNRKVHIEPNEVLEITVETSIRKGKVRITLHFTWPDEEGPQHHPIPTDN
jgi:amphi-Trp domain-containing protein